MNSLHLNVQQIDTRNNTDLTVFDASEEDESKLAKQFWNSLTLIPPVESTLFCKEIKQSIRGRTCNDADSRPRFTTAKVKDKEEKSLKDKIYDETIAFHKAQEEAKQLQNIEKRKHQVRQLFYKQATANRRKNEQLIVPQSNNHSMRLSQEQESMFFTADEDDRQLVLSLPD